MAPEVTLDYLVARAIRQYREKTVLQEEGKAEPEREPAPRPQKSYSLSGMAQSCLGCELFHAEDCGETHRARAGESSLPCRDRQVLMFMARRRIASL
jgi:hypothetical protein